MNASDRSKRIAVTGASGFIGRHVVAALEARGDRPLPIRRPFDRADIDADLTGVDAVVNLAGVISATRERDYVAGNIESARLVAAAALRAHAHFVHVSSLAAAGPAPPSAPRSEPDRPAPITSYGRTKLAGEEAIRSTEGLQWTILRPGVVYGPGDRALLPLFHYATRGLLPLVGRADAAYTFIFVDDAVAAILAAVDRALPGETMFVGHAEPVTPQMLLVGVAGALGARPRLVRVPQAVMRIAALAGDALEAATGRQPAFNSRRYTELYSPGFVCRVDRMRTRLGVEPRVNLREGLARAAAWYRERGMI